MRALSRRLIGHRFPPRLRAAAGARAEPARSIVVTGARIQDYRDRLAACLARNCPPNEDVDATLALAEALFLERRISRGAARPCAPRSAATGDQARDFPEPVSDLYRAKPRCSPAISASTTRRAARPTRSCARCRPACRGRITAISPPASRSPSADDVGQCPGRAARARAADPSAARAAGREDVATMAELRDLWFDYIACPARRRAPRRLEQWSR